VSVIWPRREWAERDLEGSRPAIQPHAYNGEFASARAPAPSIMATGILFEPHVPGERPNMPGQDVPHLSHLFAAVRCQAVISYPSRPMSCAWQLWQQVAWPSGSWTLPEGSARHFRHGAARDSEAGVAGIFASANPDGRP
jgi:hypothetical protein